MIQELFAVALFLAPATAGMLQNALDPNPSLQAYVASTQLQVTLHHPFRIHKTLTGTAYYKRPTQKIVFDNLTGPFSRFRELTTALPSTSDIARDYSLSPASDDGTHSQFVATATAQDSRVRAITFTVDDKTRLLTNVLWSYSDGSTLTIAPTYQSIGTYSLPAHEEIRAHFKDYDADGVLTLSAFQIGSTQTPARQ